MMMEATMSDESKEPLFNCPDCVAEGVNSMHPLSEFYVVNVKEYKTDQHWVKYKAGQRRSAYCRRHQDQRTGQNLRERLDPNSPRYDAALHERQKASKQSYYARKMDPNSPEYDAALHQRQLQKSRAYRERKRQQKLGSS